MIFSVKLIFFEHCFLKKFKWFLLQTFYNNYIKDKFKVLHYIIISNDGDCIVMLVSTIVYSSLRLVIFQINKITDRKTRRILISL
jgi:hypothetical protein